jgi:hypothetical protein
MFTYPVGVQLFNRPEYAEKVLLSLREQTLPLNQNLLYVYIDGFKGSIYESRGSIDKTQEVEDLARTIFPQSTVRRFQENCGIADLHNKLQEEAFSGDHPWAAFFEEDLILDKSYLQELSDLIEIVDDTEKVAKVACFQILPSMIHLPRGYDGFYPGHGTQAFAERKSFFQIKQPAVKEFIELVAQDLNQENQFVNSHIAAQLAATGHFLTYVQHDSLNEDIMHSQGKVHVVSKPNLCTDIGMKGVHSYVTKLPQIPFNTQNSIKNLSERKQLFVNQLNQLSIEAKDYRVSQFKDLFDGFYISRSRKAMLKRVILNSFLRK